MVRPLLLVLSLLLGAVLASCATLSEEQCQAGDWRAIGFNDGSRGRPADYIANHADACSEYGIAVDQALYADGRQDGLRQYCRLANAEAEGLSGDRYYGVCPGELGVSFARVHRAADAIHEATARINSIDSRITSLIGRIGQPDQTPEQIEALRLQLRSLQADRRSQQSRVWSLEQQLAQIRRVEQARLASLGISA